MFSSQTKNDEMIFFDHSLTNEKYDKYPSEYYEEIFTLLKLPPNGYSEMALDIGCGSGAWGIRLAKKGYRVIGVDISIILLKSAKNWAKKENVEFEPILCDVEYLPLKDETFKICWCGYVLHHFRNLRSIVPQLHRVLEYPGAIFAAEPNGSNIINKLSRRLMILFPQQWVMKKGIATSNERVHEIKVYIKTFKETNFESTSFMVANRIETSSTTHTRLIELLSTVRKILFNALNVAVSGSFGKTELLMKATKNRTET